MLGPASFGTGVKKCTVARGEEKAHLVAVRKEKEGQSLPISWRVHLPETRLSSTGTHLLVFAGLPTAPQISSSVNEPRGLERLRIYT